MNFLFSSFKVYFGFTLWLLWFGWLLAVISNNIALIAFNTRKHDK